MDVKTVLEIAIAIIGLLWTIGMAALGVAFAAGRFKGKNDAPSAEVASIKTKLEAPNADLKVFEAKLDAHRAESKNFAAESEKRDGQLVGQLAAITSTQNEHAKTLATHTEKFANQGSEIERLRTRVSMGTMSAVDPNTPREPTGPYRAVKKT